MRKNKLPIISKSLGDKSKKLPICFYDILFIFHTVGFIQKQP